MGRLLLLTIVLLAYGSLYPWHLRPYSTANALQMIQPWPWYLAWALRDIAVNVMVYVPLGLFAYVTFRSIARSLLLGFGLSILIEIAQIFIAGRVPSMLDVASNTAGTAIGIIAGLLWTRMPHRHAQRPDAVLLMGCWVLDQCFPFAPRWRPSITARSAADDLFLFFAEAVTLVLLVQRRRAVLALLLLTVPLKAFIHTRRATIPEIICCVVVFVLATMIPLRASLVAILLALAITVHGLAPFHFDSRPHPFSWLPFQASFFSEWEPALSVMLGKVFAYGALVWLIREAGVRLWIATTSAALLLACIETIQRYLPGRAPEIIDPLIAVILGWIFWSLKEARRARA